MIEFFFRMLPAFRGKQRLARLVFKTAIKNEKDILVEGKPGLTYKIPNIKEPIGFEIFINGTYEPEIIEFISNTVPAGGTLVDIGANIGSISFPVCKRRTDIKAICIEASPTVFEYLAFNKEINKLTNCTLLHKAVTDTAGGRVDFYSPVEKFGKGSMASVFTDEAVSVETVSIDSIFKDFKIVNNSFIKIDIEGHEYMAFKGGASILCGSQAPDILFEFADWAEGYAKGCKPGDAQKLLIEYGYTLFILNESGKLALMNEPIYKGAAMILASKKKK